MNKQNSATNSNIQCSVQTCTYHNPKNYCSLNQIQVGCSGGQVTSCHSTECASFQLGGENSTR